MRYDPVLAYLVLPFLLVVSVLGVPTSDEGRGGRGSESMLQMRTTPFFPDQPPSCPICAQVSTRRILPGKALAGPITARADLSLRAQLYTDCVPQNYSSIQSCAEAAPVLQNFTNVGRTLNRSQQSSNCSHSHGIFTDHLQSRCLHRRHQMCLR